jgi:hypothetical protein
MQRAPLASVGPFLMLLSVTACSASPSINVGGGEPDGSFAGSGGASGYGGVGGFGGGDQALTAKVTEPPSEMAIDVVTIGCAGECKQVLAVASGGNDPYTFAWSDGVNTAAREICANDDTTFTVDVTDTAFVDDEFSYPAHTVSASVTAAVLTCNDAGVADGGEDSCGAGFKPGVYEGTFAQAAGPLSGTHTLVLMKVVASATQETISGHLDNVLAVNGTMAMVTWGEGSFFDCTTQRLFLSGVRTEAGAVFPLPYTYEATYDPTDDSLHGVWAAAAPPSPGVYPSMPLDSGSWDAHWIAP